MDADIPIEQLENVYAWVDEQNLSRPKKNIARDFADGGTNWYFLVSHVLKNLNSYINLKNQSEWFIK